MQRRQSQPHRNAADMAMADTPSRSRMKIGRAGDELTPSKRDPQWLRPLKSVFGSSNLQHSTNVCALFSECTDANAHSNVPQMSRWASAGARGCGSHNRRDDGQRSVASLNECRAVQIDADALTQTQPTKCASTTAFRRWASASVRSISRAMVAVDQQRTQLGKVSSATTAWRGGPLYGLRG